ncbi:hypothetical protein FQA39_LY00738 [Lamprigera yunnana]|nr:hypothetical protein FQA39_LY00738 [Lamprigera yunnana]
MSLQSIKYEDGSLYILDQLLLPNETKYIQVNDVRDGWQVINKMQVRGAPAIAIVGCLSLVVELRKKQFEDKDDFFHAIEKQLNYLVSSRPTAINMKLAADSFVTLATKLKAETSTSVTDMKLRFIQSIEKMLEDDVKDNRAIGDHGANSILSKCPENTVRILTHCNTGSLATAGYGTALGVIRSLHSMKKLDHVYCTETRPYNQGARLTAYELVHENIPATLIVDSMVASAMKNKNVSAVVVGADRIALNGDTANKIGTYQIAILAKHHGIPFYVAAPISSIDVKVENGDKIIIEERPENEMTHIGSYRIAAPGIHCWNPSFDVTPAHLIAGIITERGVFTPQKLIEEFYNVKGKTHKANPSTLNIAEPKSSPPTESGVANNRTKATAAPSTFNAKFNHRITILKKIRDTSQSGKSRPRISFCGINFGSEDTRKEETLSKEDYSPAIPQELGERSKVAMVQNTLKWFT